MHYKNLTSKIDHTGLSQSLGWQDVKLLCDEGIEFGVASVCLPPSYVKEAKSYVNNSLKICTVIGFPNGYNTTKTKMAEAKEMLELGADELDMVINIGWLKQKQYEDVLNEIKLIKNIAQDKILKVIIETCLLNEEEKIKMCQLITESGADFIKTSTGFSKNGATLEDIKLFKQYVGSNVKIKAAGGISTLDDAQNFLNNGADRLGTSKIIKLIKNFK